MSAVRAAAGLGVAVCLCGTSAQSADLSPPVFVETPAVAVASGWYLRGDIGYRFNKIDDVTAVIAPSPTINTIDERFAFGGGIGYRAGWFRVDGTLDYGSGTKYTGDTAAIAPDYTAKISTLSALLNVYLDLGTWAGFTPYLGAGVGGTRVGLSDFSSPSFIGGVTSSDVWNVTWALMGGASYNVAPNLAFDVGYRYINFGDAPQVTDTTGNQLTIKNLAAHEIRAGVRWSVY